MSNRTAVLISSLVRAGRLSDALARLDDSVALHSKPSWIVLRAELLQLTGQNRDARRIVQRIARTKPAVALKARCELILGQICLEEEEPALSIRHFQKAVKLAANVGEMELVCRTQAKLLTTLADISTPSAVLALLREAEKNVAAFGDAHSAADFHLRVAQIEATRGEFQLAKAHLRTARTMLQVEPNQWLEGSINLSASAVHFLASELEPALQYALDALRCAVESGHARTRMAATANLGLLQLHLGRADQAEVHINEALELSEKFSVSRISLLDSYAQLQLIRGRNNDCGRVLREMEEEVSIHEPSVVSWQQMAVGSTRLRWLLAGHDWINAHELAVEMIQAADGKSDRPHQVSFRVLGADVLIALGRLDEADTLINEVAGFAEDVPIALFAEVERVRASLLASAVGTEAARQPFERSLRVLSALAGVAPRMDAARSYQRTMRPANDGLRRQLEAEPWDLNPLIQSSLPSSTSRHKESVHPPMERASPRIDIGAAEMLDRLVSKPDLLAQEAFIFLRESGHASALAIVERKKGRLERVVARAGWSIDQARRAASGSNDAVRVLVGTANDVLLEVVAAPRDNPQARAYMLYFKSLLRRSRELKSFRDTERAQFSLMTPEASSGEDAGVFVAENMRQLMAAAKQMAKTTENILIVGETGTGKEVVARLIHKWSNRSAQDFVPFNCTAVPEDLVESQLFGHRRGAFTGARDDSLGVVRAASGGTLLLDEIGDLKPDVQPKFLRFLESKEIHPLGETRPVTVDVRVIAVTNTDLDELVRQGRFREDLFYRINVFTLTVPPLRERREDILPLAHLFLRRYGKENGRPNIQITEDAKKCLLLYEWPGNVRGLANEMQRAVALGPDEGPVRLEHLSPKIIEAGRAIGESAESASPGEDAEATIPTDQPLLQAVRQLEGVMIPRAIKKANGNKALAAKALGISRKGLYLKQQRLDNDDPT